VGTRGEAGHRAAGSCPGAGGPAAARPAARYGPAPGDQAHRGADDGEPLLRQLPRHARRAGRRTARRRLGDADRGERPAGRPAHRRVAPAVDGPGRGQPDPDLARQPPRGRRRHLRRVRHGGPADRARRRPGRAHGLLDRGGPAVLLRARAHLPGGRPLVLLLPGTDVPEPAVPDQRHGARADRRPALGPDRLPARGHDLRRPVQPRHLLGELPQRAPDQRRAEAAARRRRARVFPPARGDRPGDSLAGQHGARQQVVHRRPVPARARRRRAAPADHPAVLRRRGRGDAAGGVDRGPGLRRVLGREPAGHLERRGVRRRGNQRGHARARLGVDAAAVDLRRARRLLRPCAAAARGRARRRARAELAAGNAVGAAAHRLARAKAARQARGDRRRAGDLRPLRVPGARGDRLPLRPAGLRAARRARPHLGAQADRGEVEPQPADPQGRRRGVAAWRA